MRLAACLSAFFTKEGKPRGGDKQALVTVALAKRAPDLHQRLAAEQARLVALRERLRSAEALERSVALYRVAATILKRYAMLKGTRGLLDYDDLIDRARRLIERADAAWVLYKLDASLEHLLVDEAQDTSPAQWAILAKLCEEFLAGEGARAAPAPSLPSATRSSRSSRSRAQPRTCFRRCAGGCNAATRRRRLAFAEVPLSVSFRSAPLVLAGVDAVFAAEPAWRGLTGDDGPPPPHEAFRRALPGCIEVWPPIGAEKPKEPADWKPPVDALRADEPAAVAARRIAATIKDWTGADAKERVFDVDAGGLRRVAAGDVLILVRSRGPFFEAMIRALKERDIATAGADRLLLRDSSP